MELVYLWVEKYKNIEKQGFSFSPKFTCKYDEENQELTIDENKNALENFFGENINVTAIVGENGSGKSRILEIITKFRFEKLQDKNLFILIYLDNSKLNIILNTKEDYHSFQNFNTNNIINNSKFKISSNTKEFWLSFFSNGLSDFTDKDHILSSNHYNCFYNGCDNSKKFEDKFTSLLKIKPDFFKLLNKNYIFNMMRMELNFKDFSFNFYDEEIQKITQTLKSMLQNDIDTSSYILGQEKRKITKEDYIFNFLLSFFLQKYINVVEDLSNRFPSKLKEELRKKFIENLIINIIDLKKEKKSNLFLLQILNEKYKEFKTIIIKINEKNAGELDQFERTTKELDLIENFQDYANLLLNRFELDTNQNILVALPDKIINQDITNYLEFFNQNKLFKYMYEYEYFYINFFNSSSKITFIDLSTGEKQLLSFIANYLFTLIITTKEDRILLLDEIETSMHPQWQKEIFSLIVKYIEYLRDNKILNKEKYHIILTSHSPFILSDLPKENVIFLKDGKQVEVDINPFGANIHTLLSHGFFMDGGLMGEFAKEKIDKAIKYLNQKSLSKEDIDYCEDIISIIGEPIIKNQLQRMLDSKRLSKVDKIDKLEEELELIKHRIEMIRKDK